MTQSASIAIRAARLRRSIGSWAAYRMAEKAGVVRLYVLACVLDQAQRAGL